MLEYLFFDELIKTALKEDMPFGDITTDNIAEPGTKAKAVLIAKQDMVLAGMDVFERVFKILDDKTTFSWKVWDGCKVPNGTVFSEFEGDARALLKGERTALNFCSICRG